MVIPFRMTCCDWWCILGRYAAVAAAVSVEEPHLEATSQVETFVFLLEELSRACVRAVYCVCVVWCLCGVEC